MEEKRPEYPTSNDDGEVVGEGKIQVTGFEETKLKKWTWDPLSDEQIAFMTKITKGKDHETHMTEVCDSNLGDLYSLEKKLDWVTEQMQQRELDTRKMVRSGMITFETHGGDILFFMRDKKADGSLCWRQLLPYVDDDSDEENSNTQIQTE